MNFLAYSSNELVKHNTSVLSSKYSKQWLSLNIQHKNATHLTLFLLFSGYPKLN